MKRILILMLCFACFLGGYAQGMSDTQVMQFVQKEAKAGTSQAQIVTKLIQRGVKIDQIRRIKNQYQSQIQKRGLSGSADAAMNQVESRMRADNGRKERALVSGNTQQEETQAEQEAD